MKNPNATVSLITAQIGAGLIWLCGNVLHWALSGEASIEIAGAITAVVLFVGREGIRGAWRRIVDGPEKASGRPN